MKKFISTFLFLVALSSFAQEDKTNPETNKINIAQDTVKPKEQKNELKEVTIAAAQKKYFKIEANKTTVNVVDNSLLNSGSSFDAVKRLPGIITSPTSSLSLNGKSVRIYIDGSPSNLTGNDLQNYLSSLPANAIEKIELIYNPGASYDANSSGSVINIVMSSKRLKGINATANINYNFNKYQKPSPQILLNGKEKYFSWQTMLGYNYIDSEEKSLNNQDFISFNPIKKLNQDNFKVDTERNLYFRMGTNFKLSKMSNLLFNYNLNSANDRSVYSSKTSGDVSDYETNGVSKNKNFNNDLSLQLKTKLDTIGTTMNIVSYFNTFNKNPKNLSTATGNTFNNSEVDFGLLNYYLKTDFTFPFQKIGLSIDTGAKYNILKVKNNGDYFASSITPNSIKFDYTENNLAFYVEASKKWKKFNFTAGLRYENFDVKRVASTLTNEIKFNNSNFFPNLSALYELAPQVNISASYSKKIEQPSYSNIDPNNGSNFNQYNASTGNVLLKPTFFDNYEFKISAMDFIQLGVNYTVGKDDNRFIFNAEPGQLVSNQTTQAFDKIKTFSAFLSFPIPLDFFFKGKEEFKNRMATIDKMNYIFLNINYVKSSIDGFTLPYGNNAITNYSAQAQIILPWGVTNTINYFILPTGTWEIYKIEKPIQQFDISFVKTFLDKKLKVGLHAFDVFNKNEINALISGQNLDTRFFQKKDSREFRISLTYNFGNLKLEKENTKIETDKVKQGGGLIK
jgi:iron complex outermembrane recepter protein